MDYGSERWKKKRELILRRDGYQCQISKRYGKMIPATVVHHIYPAEDYPEFQWQNWNLISISQAVHNALHDRYTGKLTKEGIALLNRTAQKRGLKIQYPPGKNAEK